MTSDYRNTVTVQNIYAILIIRCKEKVFVLFIDKMIICSYSNGGYSLGIYTRKISVPFIG